MTMMIMTERRNQRTKKVERKMILMMMMMDPELNQNQKVVVKEMNQKHQRKITKYFSV